MRTALAMTLELAGLAGLSYGLWLAWSPLGIVAAGVCAALIGLAISGGGKR